HWRSWRTRRRRGARQPSDRADRCPSGPCRALAANRWSARRLGGCCAECPRPGAGVVAGMGWSRSTGCKGLSQGAEVGAHDAEVIVSTRVLDSLDGIEYCRGRACVAGDGVGEVGADQRFEEDRRDASFFDLALNLLNPRWCRLCLGRESGDRDLLQAVAFGEIPERGMRGDERLLPAVPQAGAEVGVQAVQPGDQRGGPCPEAGGMRRGCRGELLSPPPGEGGEVCWGKPTGRVR